MEKKKQRDKCGLCFQMLMDVKSLFAWGGWGGSEQGYNVTFLFNFWRRLRMCIVIVASNRICKVIN